MLTFPGPFTVCINFIEVVGLEEIHEKNCKGREEQKQWATAHFGFFVATENFLSRQRILVLCRDRYFGFPVAIESPGRNGATCSAVRTCMARTSWRSQHDYGCMTRRPCERDRACARG